MASSASVLHPTATSLPSFFLLLSPPLPYRQPSSLQPSLSLSKSKFHFFPLSSAAAATAAAVLSRPPPAPEPPYPLVTHTQTTVPFSYPDTQQSVIEEECLHILQLSARNSDVDLARKVHCRILKLDEEHTRLKNALISTYLKLHMVADACRVFKSLSHPNVVSYTSLISGFAKMGRELEAIRLFFRMRIAGIEPNEFTFVAILTACMRLLQLDLGLQVHALATKFGYRESVFVSNTLMGLYNKCGCSDSVFQLFDEMTERDVASWNVVISSSVRELLYQKAAELFHEMLQTDGFRADDLTLSTLLAACTNSFDCRKGREIHAQAIRTGLDGSLSLNNALIAFYTKCGSQKDLEAVFERMTVKDAITWTEMITAYMKFGLVEMAMSMFGHMPGKSSFAYNALLAGLCDNDEAGTVLDLFVNMVEQGLEITEFTLTTVVKACGLLKNGKMSEQIHGFIAKFGLGSNTHVEAALLDMCTRCGRMEDAEKMFTRWSYDDSSSIVSTSMICGYSRNGQPDVAISLFCNCHSAGGLVVDEVASTSILGVCGTLGSHEMGQQIHCHAIKSGIISDLPVANAIMSMYAKCWNLENALKVFRIMPKHDIASWNGLIAGHVLHRQGDEALSLWSKLKNSVVKPDQITFLFVISAYRHTKACLLEECQELFLSMRTTYNIEPLSEHYASLVGVFGFWGFLEQAEKLIVDMPLKPEALVWRALLDGCRINSNAIIGKRAVKQLLSMEPQDPSSYILISNLYSASGRWHCSEAIRKEMSQKGLRKLPARSWVIHQNKIVSFYTRDKSHSQSKDIYSGLEILIRECLKAGYVPDTNFVLQEVEEYQKTHFLFYHSAKLAAAFGLLMTKPGKPIKIVKNILLCGDCHAFLKYASVVTNREILMRDASGFHRFADGHCSCKDHW